MAYTPKCLYRGQPPSTGVDCFTVGSAQHAIVTHIAIVNLDTVAHTLTLHNVPSGGSPDDTNVAFQGSISPGDPVFLDMAMVFEGSDKLHAVADVDDTITLIVSAARGS